MEQKQTEIRIACPQCHQHYRMPDSENILDSTVTCPQCGVVFTVRGNVLPPKEEESSDSTGAHRTKTYQDPDRTMPPRNPRADTGYDDPTMPGKRDRRAAGRFQVGDVIMDRYQVLSELGQGGMGVVYRCFDQTAGIEIALKALPPELSHSQEEMEDIKENFQLVHNLHHPNIASSNNLEKDSSNGNYYLIMEYVQGESLRQWIRKTRKNNAISIDTVYPIIRQVAEALDYAHSQKVIHRDIKPGNIMIDSAGTVKVLDFGLAAQIHSSMTRISMAYHGTSGTGPYMAPEQWKGRAQGAAADQYALAVMTYEMLAGHLPFDASDPAVLREAVLNDTPENIADIPISSNRAILKAMSKEPKERFAVCSDFGEALTGTKKNYNKLRKIKLLFRYISNLALKAYASCMPFLQRHITKKRTVWFVSLLVLCIIAYYLIPHIPNIPFLSKNIPIIGKIDAEAEEQKARQDAAQIGVKFSNDLHRLISFPNDANLTTYKIPSCVVVIENKAFCDCEKIKHISIPHSVTKIGDGVFSKCSNLKEIAIPDSVASIGSECFRGCVNLQKVSLPDGLEVISDYSFYECKKLQTITIPSSVKIIGKYSFMNSGIRSVDIPDSVQKLGSNAFENCIKLRDAKLSKYMTCIDNSSFASCSSLTEIDIPPRVSTIFPYAFFNCTSLKKVIFHNGLTTIEQYAFSDCPSLRKIIIPESLRSMYYNSFNGNPCEKDVKKQFEEIKKMKAVNRE